MMKIYYILEGWINHILFKMGLKDKLVWIIAIISVILSYLLNSYSIVLLNGYEFGFELLIVNGLFTFAGLYLIKEKQL